MARFNLGARMEEVEYSMCAGENCSVVNGNNMNKPLKDNEVVFLEAEELQAPSDIDEEAL